MIPIPKNLSTEYNEESSLNQGHYLDMAFERVMHSYKISKSHLDFQLTFPTPFDEAGIRMLDSICEIFDILGIRFESIGFYFDEFKQCKPLIAAIEAGKCPVIGVPKSLLNPTYKTGIHAMVATGIKKIKGVQCIQMKNSIADNPNEPGIVR